MFNKKEYQAAFDKVTASEGTYQEVLNMTKDRNQKKGVHGRKLVVLVAAVITLLAITVTAFAAEYIASWFQSYFAQFSEKNLTQEQIDYIEVNEQHINKSQKQNGWTMELRSAINDGTTAYVIIGITAPEGTNLSRNFESGISREWFCPANEADEIVAWPNNVALSSVTYGMQEDGDGLGNTMNYVIQISPNHKRCSREPFGTDTEWNVHLENFVHGYEDLEYKQKLLDGKYKGQTDVIFTSEETEQIYCEEVLVEGTWDFSFTFEDADAVEVELIDEPVTASAAVAWNEDGSGVMKEVQITSFTLRALSATIHCDHTVGTPDFSDNDENAIYVVMKDGSQIKLASNNGFPGEQGFLAASPIILENVDHVLLADGTILTMPALPTK